MVTRYSPGSDYTGLPQNLLPLDRSIFPLGRSAPGAGIQAIHRCLGHRLGSHVQWARSSGVWMGLQLRLHSNCRELLAEFLSLSRLRWRLQGKDVLVHTENTATFLHISSGNAVTLQLHVQLTHNLLLWSQKLLRLLRAIHIPEVFNQTADELSRAALLRRLHPRRSS